MAARITWPDGNERLFLISGIQYQVANGAVTTQLTLELWTAAPESAYSSGEPPVELQDGFILESTTGAFLTESSSGQFLTAF